MWTLGIWLEHWVENIAEKYVSENAYDRYEVDVRVQLVPGVRAHKLDRLEPEYLGTFHAKMQASRSSADTAHHVHRTVRVSLEDVPTRSHHDQRRRDRPSASTIGPPEPVVKLLRKHQEEQEREPGSQGSSGRTRGPLIPGTTGGSNSLPTPVYVMVACLLLARLLGPCFFCSGSRMSWWTRSQVGRLGEQHACALDPRTSRVRC
ncbi:hypothetical protein DT87_15240 [Streptomyces sp. NTK 937]|nr:hypothetical protein DT87_15240 [Streptomyces sp. NTK 937]